MRYEEFPPVPPLRPFVECLWTMTSEGRPAPPDTGTIFPDGNVELVVDFGDGVTRESEGPPRRLEHMLVGQMDSVARVTFRGVVDLLAVRFRPGGAYAFLAAPLDQIARQVVALDDVAARLERPIRTDVDPAWPTPRRIAAVETILLRVLAHTAHRDLRIETAARVMEASHGRVAVSAVSRELGLSARQLERRFLRSVGLPPKLLCRILRFRRASTLLTTHPSLTDVALECGYFDQSHMIRDFGQFAGMTPATFAASLG